MSWFSKIDWGDVAGTVGDWIGGNERASNIRANKRVAEFNRHIDEANLAIFIQRMRDTRSVKTHLQEAAKRRVAAAETGILYHETEGAYHTVRRDWQAWLARSEAGEIRDMGRAETAVERAELDAASFRLESEARLAGRRGLVLDARAQADRSAFETGLDTVAAQRNLLRAEDMAREGTSAAQVGREAATGRRITQDVRGAQRVAQAEQRALGAGRARLGGERAALATTTGIRRAERIGQAYEEAGAGVVAGAARGLRGSSAMAAQAEAAQDAGRDLALQEAEATVQSLALAEREAQIGAAGTRADVQLEGIKARAGEQLAALDLDRAQRMGEDLTFGARQGVRTAELAGREADIRGRYGIATAQEGLARQELREQQGQRVRGRRVLRRRGELADERLRYTRERATRRERAGEVSVAQEQLGVGRAEIARTRAQADFYVAKGDEISQGAELWQADAGKALAEWQLENLPKLPDYEGAQTRNAIGTFLNIMGRW